MRPSPAGRVCRRNRGQAAVELALAVPVVSLLMIGAANVGLMIADNANADFSVRQGVRLATTVGGNHSNPGDATATAAADLLVVQDVLSAAKTMSFAQPLEVDIYQPTTTDGHYVAGNNVDVWDVSGATPTQVGPDTFPLSQRVQDFPNETSIGVRMIWRYDPTNWLSLTPSVTFTHYAVFKELALTS